MIYIQQLTCLPYIYSNTYRAGRGGRRATADPGEARRTGGHVSYCVLYCYGMQETNTSAVPYDHWCMGTVGRSRMEVRKEKREHQQNGCSSVVDVDVRKRRESKAGQGREWGDRRWWTGSGKAG